MHKDALKAYSCLLILAVASYAVSCRKKTLNNRSGSGHAEINAEPTTSPSPEPSTTASPTPSPSTMKTKYPVIFFNGFAATKQYGSYHKLASTLASKGIDVFVADNPSLFFNIEQRAGVVAENVNEVLKATNASKVNIIAHSMGGLDARYLISTMKYADRVASLTTISTPHAGSRIADIILDPTNVMQRTTLFEDLLGSALSGAGALVLPAISPALENLRSTYLIEQFNVQNPNAAGIYYQSYGARTGSDSSDQIKIPLLASFAALNKPDPQPNDGLVTVASATWGTYRATLDADHWDLVCVSALDTKKAPFLCDEFYPSVIADLAAKGY